MKLDKKSALVGLERASGIANPTLYSVQRDFFQVAVFTGQKNSSDRLYNLLFDGKIDFEGILIPQNKLFS